MTVADFAHLLPRALVAKDPRAGALVARTRGKMCVVGVMDGDDWVPLFRLNNPSASVNVMSLAVRHGRGWAVTFLRGTPALLAAELLGPLAFTGQIDADAARDGKRTSDPKH